MAPASQASQPTVRWTAKDSTFPVDLGGRMLDDSTRTVSTNCFRDIYTGYKLPVLCVLFLFILYFLEHPANIEVEKLPYRNHEKRLPNTQLHTCYYKDLAEPSSYTECIKQVL